MIVPPNDFGASDDSEFIGGGQIGCDYQVNDWVLGLQGKVDFGDIRSSRGVPRSFPRFPAPTAFTSNDRTKNVVTATARAGYLFTRRCWLTSRAVAPGRGPTHTSSAMFLPIPLEIGLGRHPPGLDRRRRPRMDGRPGLVGVWRIQLHGLRPDSISFVAGPLTVGAPGYRADPPDHAAGTVRRELQVQLGWACRRRLLINAKTNMKAPGHAPGAFAF